LEQPIYPTSQLGWSNRLKSSHFDFYDGVTQEFSAHIGLDAWFINPLSEGIDGVDFMQQTGLDELAATVDNVLERVQTRFNQYGISESPFAIVKADNGTYGMSVMSVHKGSQLLELNRKQRTRMSARKGSQKVTRVLVQEGIYSVERINSHAVSEPVIYLIGPFVVGGFYRVHHERAQHESLNTPGMYFEPLSLKTPKFEDYNEARALIPDNRFYIYGVIARLATLAAAREMAASGGNR
jgi:glutamate--cysteine ligase